MTESAFPSHVRRVTIVEVGPRDGLQNESAAIPTETKLAFIRALVDAGLAHIEATSFVNPKVEPGKVRWHRDFAAACKAAEKSGKPVLLFQMMGKLDDRFC